MNKQNIQSLSFPKSDFTIDEIEQYLTKHNYTKIKPIHNDENFYRVRLIDPHKFLKYYTWRVENPTYN